MQGLVWPEEVVVVEPAVHLGLQRGDVSKVSVLI